MCVQPSAAPYFAQPIPGMTGRKEPVGGNSLAVGGVFFRKAALLFLWVLVFVIPWENAVVIPGFGTLGRAVGIVAFGIGLLAALESGSLRAPSFQHLFMIFFILWGSFTYLWSFAPAQTLTGIVTFSQLLTMVWLIWEFAQTHREQILLLRAYVLGAGVSSVATIVNYFQGNQDQGRYTGLHFNPGDLALILALSIPVALYLAVRDHRRLLVSVYGIEIVAAFCAILLTAARGALLACSATALMFAILLPKMRGGRKVAAALFVILAGMAAWLVTPESSWSRLSTIGQEISAGTLNQRTLIWSVGWQVFGESPFTGVGLRAYAPSVDHALNFPTHGEVRANAPLAQLVAHNTFFSVLVEQGVIGFALLLMVMLTLVISAWRLPVVERVFWLSFLLTWGIGVSNLTWEDRKPTWFLFGTLIAAACKRIPQVVHTFRPQVLDRGRRELAPQTMSSALTR
jgi:O-antigen ligase